MIRNSDYEVQFPLEWMYKDMQLLSQTAYEQQHPLFFGQSHQRSLCASDTSRHGQDGFCSGSCAGGEKKLADRLSRASDRRLKM